MIHNSNYHHTILLPQTTFSMRADLVNKEPKILQYWQQMSLWQKVRDQSKHKPIFTLHDGPPYANGSIHLGTTLNKILKDVINRYQQMTDKNANYIPGWDCHGLPIEWIVEKQYRAQNKPITRNSLRLDCAKFAQHWMQIQKTQFQQLGVLADWDHAYYTTQKHLEADIVKTITNLLMANAITQRYQTVLWSTHEKTSLAESEVEYHTINTQSVYIAFALPENNNDNNSSLALLIWTTAIWTIVGNRALAINPDYEYAIYKLEEIPSYFKFTHIIIAKNQAKQISTNLNLQLSFIKNINISNYTSCQHPLQQYGYAAQIPILPADFVNLEQGTGIVHIAPGHGENDFMLGKKYNLNLSSIIEADGRYIPGLPVIHDKYYESSKQEILTLLTNSGHLLGTQNITHKYPHSWRSKKPLIYRSTKQWFIDLHNTNIKNQAIEALKTVTFIPAVSKNRMISMLKKRPDWLISRQRHWGIPLTLFVHKKTGMPLQDSRINQKIYDIIHAQGSNAWFDLNTDEFLAPYYQKQDYYQVQDILDIWFESGCSHIFLKNHYNHVSWPIDLYLEGSDQHRGWFQTSLLVSCSQTQMASYKNIITHGFVLDASGYKMSKSLSNVVSPQDIINKYGAEILRLWCVSSDYTKDIKISDHAITDNATVYRRIRNTLRFIMGNLYHSQGHANVPYQELPELEKFMLYQLFQLTQSIFASNQKYDIHNMYQKLYHFCDIELSSKYFEIRKDSLYCDPLTGHKRQSICTVLQYIFDYLLRLWAPILPFTTEEAWMVQYGKNSSIHLQQLLPPIEIWNSYKKIHQWHTLFNFKKHLQQIIETAKQQENIKSQDEMKLVLHMHHANPWINFELSNILLVPQLEIYIDALSKKINRNKYYSYCDDNIKIDFQILPATDYKCARCRLQRVLSPGQELCMRCSKVISNDQ